ncbi:hypothetical protein ANCDUO_23795, partial [Ancylostoma duodenale]
MRQRFAKETEEQRLERLRINKERRRRKRAMETEEKRLERLQREREQRLASETRWRRLEKARETARRKRANETAEERAERLEHQRERRRQKMEEAGVAENSERLLAERARKRMFRVRETAEQRQRRLEKEREKRRLKRENETEEERAERMRIDRERVRQKRAKETPEERSNRLQRERVRERARKFLNRLQMEERTGRSDSGESIDTFKQFDEADKNFGALPKTLFGLVAPSKEFIYYGKPPFRDVNINNVYDKWRVTARFTGFEEQKLCRCSVWAEQMNASLYAFSSFLLDLSLQVLELLIVLNPDDAYKITVRARARYNHLLGMPHEFKAVLKAFILHVCGDEDPSSDLSFVLDGILSYTPNERDKQVVHHNPLSTPKVEHDESAMLHTPKLHLEESSITFVDPIEGTIEE